MIDLTSSQQQQQQQRASKEISRMKGGGAVAAVAVVVALLAAAVAVDGAVITCGDVDASLRPCVGYVTGKEAAPPAECCAGVKRLRTLPTSTEERRFVCGCVKEAAARYEGLKSDAIRDLPAKCDSPLPFPIALDFDCTTVP